MKTTFFIALAVATILALGTYLGYFRLPHSLFPYFNKQLIGSDRPSLPEESAFSADAARDIALKSGGQAYLDSHPSARLGPVRLYDNKTHGLVWTVVFPSSSGEWFDIFVNAKTGEVVQKRGPFFPSI
jgi:hypothetical protein